MKVHEIKGQCSVYKIGDKMVVDDPKILLDRADALCTGVNFPRQINATDKSSNYRNLRGNPDLSGQNAQI
jgi:hypothetical protein